MRYWYYSLIVLSLLASSVLCEETAINFGRPAAQPFLVASQLTLDAGEYNTLELKIASAQDGTCRFFWASNYQPQFHQALSISFFVRTGEHNYYFDLPSQNPNWLGWINGFLLYPEFDPGLLQVQQAKLATGNLLTGFISRWQEFFTFEAPQPRTVNFIYGPKINGKSVNLYVYWFIIACSLLYPAFIFTKSRNWQQSLRSGAKVTMIICLFCWIALDLRILIDQARTVRFDVQTYYGKSLEEKRALTTPGDYYHFLKFAESQLPARSRFNLVHPPNYYYLEKANYYLYPNQVDQDADFLLVYDPGKNLANQLTDYLKGGYQLFATYKEGEYILKK